MWIRGSSLVFSLFSVFYCIESTLVRKCNDTDAILPEVNITNCDIPPCYFYIGEVTVLQMGFKAPKYLENITPEAQVYALSITIPYDLGQEDACEGITNTRCPLLENEYTEYQYDMEVSPAFPTLSVDLQYSIIDNNDNKTAVVCFKALGQFAKRT